MSAGEAFFWAIASLVGLLVLIALIDAQWRSMHPRNWIGEEEIQRIEDETGERCL